MVQIYIGEKSYNIDGILFDKDGTLLDFHALWIEWSNNLVQHICTEAKIDVSHRKKLSASIGVDWDTGDWDVKGPLAIGTTQDLISILAHELYQLAIPWNTAFEIVTKTVIKVNETDDWQHRIKAMPGLKQFIEACHQHQLRLGVVTSDDHQHAVEHLEVLGIDTYFQAFVGGDQVTHGKPFPESAEKACEQMNVDPRCTLVIGDSDGDMVLGNNIRAQANIGVIQKTNETKHFLHADHLIRSYDEITFQPKKV